LRLPQDQAYNSFVVLDNGLIVTKNLSDTIPAALSVIDPQTLKELTPASLCPEPSVARLSALGNTVYVVGVRSIFRYHWNEPRQCLVFDADWRFDYIGQSSQSYGWDVVLDGVHAWFMDNGKHRYRINMLGAGVSPTPNRLIRVSLTDASNHECIEVSGLPAGSITNPPLFDITRRIVVAFDSANKVLKAWRFAVDEGALQPLWQKQNFGAASHMVLYADTGELVVNDYRRMGEEVVVLKLKPAKKKAECAVGASPKAWCSPAWAGRATCTGVRWGAWPASLSKPNDLFIRLSYNKKARSFYFYFQTE